jgi:hypothetical protein
MADYYVLKDKAAVLCESVLEWAKWYETADRIVAKDVIGESSVSTVFIGLDHSFGGPVPLIFETMVFGGTLDGEQDRYSTWGEAVSGHQRTVQRVLENAKETPMAAPNPIDLSDEITEYAALENRRMDLKDELVAIESKIAELAPRVLEWFQASGTQKITRDGRTLYLKRELWAGRAEGVSNEAAVAALEGAGLNEFCGMKVNTQSLSAWMREREKEGQAPVPTELEGAFVANEVFKVGSRRS